MIPTLKWNAGKLFILDQTALPFKKNYIRCVKYTDVIKAIREMKLRGAPLIGITTAYGIAMASRQLKSRDPLDLADKMEKVFVEFHGARPTARNLDWAIERMRKVILSNPQRKIGMLQEILLKEAQTMEREDVSMNQAMGKLGAEFVREGDCILTYCNTGSLATGGYGTALGVIRAALAQGKKIKVLAGETRPYLQGARLTAFELKEEGIPFHLITDNMAGYFMRRKEVQVVVVGADRIVANGDAANKIGTYTLAVLAWENRIPFYIVAPTSTIDFSVPSGDSIPVEERDPEEVISFMGVRIAPKGTPTLYPAFDITPSRYISAIITERGVARAPYTDNLRKLMEEPPV